MKSMTKNELRLIQDILYSRAYNFACRIAPIYRLLDWKWALPDGDEDVPSVPEINKELEEMIKMLKRNKNGWEIDSGGLVVGYKIDEGDYIPYMYMKIED